MAERDRRARITHAEGEMQAAQKVAEAARILNEQEGGLFIRTLQTISDATSEKATTVVIPLPIELMKVLERKKEK